MRVSQVGQPGLDGAEVDNPPSQSVWQRIRLSYILLAGLMLLAFAEMAWLSVARYRGYNAFNYDLGVMSQAIWSASKGKPLVFTLEGFPLSRLARHVELIYFAFAPLYRLFPSPITLLVSQALIYSAGAIPVYRLANRRLAHSGASLGLVVVYLLYPALQTAVLFDFHGDTLAVPILLFAIEAADRRAWGSYAIWTALGLACKLYVAVPVAVMGFILWLKGERRVGMWTIAASTIWGLFAFFVIRSVFAPTEGALVQATSDSYIAYYFGQLGNLGESALPRLVNVVVVVIPVIWLAWRSAIWLLPALAVIVPVALSSGPGPSYDYRFHHYALAVPFLIAATLYAAARLKTSWEERPLSRRRRPWHLPVAVLILITIIINSFFVNTPLNLAFFRAPVGSMLGMDMTSYGRTARDGLKDQWLNERIPSSAAIASQGGLGVHLTSRPTLYWTDHPEQVKDLQELLPEVEYVVTDALYDFAVGTGDEVNDGGVTYEKDTIQLMLETPTFGLVEERDGLLLFERGERGLRQNVSSQNIAGTPLLAAEFGDAVGLVSAEVRELGQGKYLAHYQWTSLKPLTDEPQYIAVTRLGDVEHSRLPHLPTMVLKPTPEWRPEELIDEQFEFTLPDDLASGTYELLVGWYDSSLLAATETDARSRLGNEIMVGQLTVP